MKLLPYTGLMHTLNKDAAYAILYPRNSSCVAIHSKYYSGESSRLACKCGRCSLARTITRGRNLNENVNDSKHEPGEQLSETPLLLLKSLAFIGFKNSISVLCLIIVISLPIVLISSKNNVTSGSKLFNSGVDISEEQIIQYIPVLPKIQIAAPPTSLRISPTYYAPVMPVRPIH